MVNLTRFLFLRNNSYQGSVRHRRDPNWRRRQILKLSANFYGRPRNCFDVAIRKVQKYLQYIRIGRKTRKEWMKNIWNNRIDAGVRELGHMPEGVETMLEGLARSEVYLNRQSLSNFAVYEPRTFAALEKIAAVKAHEDRLARYLGPFPKGILGKL